MSNLHLHNVATLNIARSLSPPAASAVSPIWRSLRVSSVHNSTPGRRGAEQSSLTMGSLPTSELSASVKGPPVSLVSAKESGSNNLEQNLRLPGLFPADHQAAPTN